MRTIAWLLPAGDLAGTGALRQLALPALMAEGAELRSRLVRPGCEWSAKSCDMVVASVRALGGVPGLPPTPPLIVHLDDAAVLTQPAALDQLRDMQSRVHRVVAGGPLALGWAQDHLDRLPPPTPVGDPAASAAELAAAALRFGLPTATAGDPPPAGPIWFAEPDDPIAPDEIDFVRHEAELLADAGRSLALVAPPAILRWLAQLGIGRAEARRAWSPEIVERAIRSGVDVHLPPGPAASRRRARVARAGGLPLLGDAAVRRPADVGAAWRTLLAPPLPPAAPRPVPQRRLAVLLHLIQDLPLAEAIVADAARRPSLAVRCLVTDALSALAPEAAAAFAARGAEIVSCAADALLDATGPGLEGTDALLTLAETSLPPHRHAHALTLAARAQGVPSFTLQHGLENVGINYADPATPDVEIASDYVLAWFPPDAVPGSTPARLRPRLIHTGRPSARAAAGRPVQRAGYRRLIAVFENLHWSRYDPAFRERFVADCFGLARILNDSAVVIRPHPAGRWLTRRSVPPADRPPNLLIADPAHRDWSRVTAASLIASADTVLTTPSSVAVDAVWAGRRTGVVAYDLDVPAYAPLPILRRFEDWLAFTLSHPHANDALARARFLDRVLVSGEAEEGIVDAILARMARPHGTDALSPAVPE